MTIRPIESAQDRRRARERDSPGSSRAHRDPARTRDRVAHPATDPRRHRTRPPGPPHVGSRRQRGRNLAMSLPVAPLASPPARIVRRSAACWRRKAAPGGPGADHASLRGAFGEDLAGAAHTLNSPAASKHGAEASRRDPRATGKVLRLAVAEQAGITRRRPGAGPLRLPRRTAERRSGCYALLLKWFGVG
jgi:hypothetical protein